MSRIAIATEPRAQTEESTPTATAARISYEPGLDGLRAVALLSIFVVHADIGGASGGFLAVSTFFTLSGFLITSLLTIEHQNHGHVALGAFWARRARRLLPALLLAILGITIATLWLGDASQLSQLKGDTIGALTYVANWRFIAAGDKYGAAFGGQSPLLHFWSLAIEEQFYLVFPLVCAVAFALARRWRHAVVVVFGLGTVASLLAGIIESYHHATVDRLYFGTDVRAAELLVGALLALWWVPRRGRISPRLHRTIRFAGIGALALMLFLIATAQTQDLVWYRGGLLAYSLVTATVILAAVELRGPVRTLLSWRPLVAIGTISYGAYLVHWPIFLWLRIDTSVPGYGRLVLGTAGSLGLAAVSYRFLERPIRERRWNNRPVLLGAGSVLVVAALVVGCIVAPARLKASKQVPLDSTPRVLHNYLTYSLAKPGQAPSVGVFGDSTALVDALGLAEWDDSHTAIRATTGWAGLGCSIMSPAQLYSGGQVVSTPPLCTGWLQHWRSSPYTDISLVVFGPWEVHSIEPAGFGRFAVVGDPALDAVLERDITEGVEALLAHTKVVVMVTSPYIDSGRVDGKSPATAAPESDHSRMDRLNLIIREVASRFPRVALIDLASYVNHEAHDRQIRPDGVHFTIPAAITLAGKLGPTLDSFDLAPGQHAPPADELLPIIKRPDLSGS